MRRPDSELRAEIANRTTQARLLMATGGSSADMEVARIMGVVQGLALALGDADDPSCIEVVEMEIAPMPRVWPFR